MKSTKTMLLTAVLFIASLAACKKSEEKIAAEAETETEGAAEERSAADY